MIYDDVPNFEGKFYYTPRLVIKNGLKLYLFQLNVFGMMEKKIEIKNLYKSIDKFIRFEFCI
jgi:hypothetical protein